MKNIKNKKCIIFFTAMMMLVVTNLGFSKIRKARTFVDNLSTLVHEAKAGGESVTCHSDTGDSCTVGTTSVDDYDEGCASWFWG
jgi:hypothetical protein